MTNRHQIVIAGRIYRKNSDVDRYQIHLDDLGDLCVRDIPPHSLLEILGLTNPKGAVDTECVFVNGGDEGDIQYLSVYGGTTYRIEPADRTRVALMLKRAFPNTTEGTEGYGFPNPHITIHQDEHGMYVHVFLRFDFKDRPDINVREAVEPYLEGFARLNRADTYAFICHASEDKPAARQLAAELRRGGAEVWFDEWEIRVGDSIIQRIDGALSAVSHLIVLLSKNSVNKPWVQKELSSALMLQLSKKSIRVLPVRLDDCTIPAILADIKYADGRAGVENALAQLEHALFWTD